jgi:hypothetical protein
MSIGRRTASKDRIAGGPADDLELVRRVGESKSAKWCEPGPTMLSAESSNQRRAGSRVGPAPAHQDRLTRSVALAGT